MDRKRSRPKHRLPRAIGGYLKVSLVLVGVVAAVAAIPVVFLWLFLPQEPAESVEVALAPTAPLPPRVEEVTFTNGVAPMTGLLHVPPEAGPHPAVVVVGAGAELTRDHFPDVGEALARAGIMALTEPGASRRAGGSSSASWTADLALAALAFLGAQPDVRWTRLGVVDLTEAGAVALRVAARSDEVAFAVLTAIPGLPRDDGAESELAALDVPSLWLFDALAPSDRSEASALLDALRASGKPFAYHVGTDAGLRNGDALEQSTDVGAVIDSWLRETGLR